MHHTWINSQRFKSCANFCAKVAGLLSKKSTICTKVCTALEPLRIYSSVIHQIEALILGYLLGHSWSSKAKRPLVQAQISKTHFFMKMASAEAVLRLRSDFLMVKFSHLGRYMSLPILGFVGWELRRWELIEKWPYTKLFASVYLQIRVGFSYQILSCVDGKIQQHPFSIFELFFLQSLSDSQIEANTRGGWSVRNGKTSSTDE